MDSKNEERNGLLRPLGDLFKEDSRGQITRCSHYAIDMGNGLCYKGGLPKEVDCKGIIIKCELGE